MTRARCVHCGKRVTKILDFCYGCRQHVCDDCTVKEKHDGLGNHGGFSKVYKKVKRTPR